MNLYIHIPFCTTKCSYCHFYSCTSMQMIQDFVDALTKDVKTNLPSDNYTTIYIGGGTPSLLNTQQIGSIIQSVRNRSTSVPLEITLEANPDSLLKMNPHELLATGVNRISLGIQSWQPEILKAMGRKCNPQSLGKYIMLLRESGLQNLNLDHIIAFPDQTPNMLQDDLNKTLSLNPEHISIYPLEIHANTSLFQKVSSGHCVLKTAKETIQAFSHSQITLQQSGYRHYEELSFSKPGFECIHNTDFWQGKDYLGFGPGAVSRKGITVIENDCDTAGYLKNISSGFKPSRKTTLLTESQLIILKSDLKERYCRTNIANSN